MWAVGVLVISVIVLSAVIPGVYQAITGANPSTAITGEIWVGTAATPHAMAHSPMQAVTSFKKTAVTSASNTVALPGAAGTRTITTVLPIDVAGTMTLTVVSSIAPGNTTNVTVGTCYLGTLTGPSDAWSAINATSCGLTTSPVTVRFQSTDTGNNITNVTLGYAHFADNTAYSVDLVPGTITPVASSRYYTSYTYGTPSMTNVNTILLLTPLLIAVALLLIVMGPLM